MGHLRKTCALEKKGVDHNTATSSSKSQRQRTVCRKLGFEEPTSAQRHEKIKYVMQETANSSSVSKLSKMIPYRSRLLGKIETQKCTRKRIFDDTNTANLSSKSELDLMGLNKSELEQLSTQNIEFANHNVASLSSRTELNKACSSKAGHLN